MEKRITLYLGKSIAKFLPDGVEKGDAGFLDWEDQPERIFPLRFFLEDVIFWELYSDPTETYTLNGKKDILLVSITSLGGKANLLIVEDLDVFDLLMDEIIERRKKEYDNK